MVTRLGFTWEEAIALLGAHSLGSAHKEYSGYEGRWVPYPANYFSNSFYKVLLKNNWYRIDVHGASNYGGGAGSGYGSSNGNDHHYEYISDATPGSFMLTTDVGLGWNLNNYCNVTNGYNSGSNGYNSAYGSYANYNGPCTKRRYWNIIARFANDNNYWLQVFAQAFEKLQTFGGDYLTYNNVGDVGYGVEQSSWAGFGQWYSNPFDVGTYYAHGNGVWGSVYNQNKNVQEHGTSYAGSSNNNYGSSSNYGASSSGYGGNNNGASYGASNGPNNGASYGANNGASYAGPNTNNGASYAGPNTNNGASYAGPNTNNGGGLSYGGPNNGLSYGN